MLLVNKRHVQWMPRTNRDGCDHQMTYSSTVPLRTAVTVRVFTRDTPALFSLPLALCDLFGVHGTVTKDDAQRHLLYYVISNRLVVDANGIAAVKCTDELKLLTRNGRVTVPLVDLISSLMTQLSPAPPVELCYAVCLPSSPAVPVHHGITDTAPEVIESTGAADYNDCVTSSIYVTVPHGGCPAAVGQLDLALEKLRHDNEVPHEKSKTIVKLEAVDTNKTDETFRVNTTMCNIAGLVHHSHNKRTLYEKYAYDPLSLMTDIADYIRRGVQVC